MLGEDTVPAQLLATSVLGTWCDQVRHSSWLSGKQGAGGGAGPSREELKRRHVWGDGVPGECFRAGLPRELSQEPA